MRNELLSIVALSLSFSVFAEEPQPQLEAHKERVLKKIDERIAELQASKTCISNAKDHKTLKDCKKGRHKDRDKGPPSN
ncbi:MAG: hypothetical protein KA116_11600 [Proteobacteria bacterium]|nr:hypothetical protein [Pseudomonadota bacterium]